MKARLKAGDYELKVEGEDGQEAFRLLIALERYFVGRRTNKKTE